MILDTAKALVQMFFRPFTELNWPGSSHSILWFYCGFMLVGFSIVLLKDFVGGFSGGLGLTADSIGRGLGNKIRLKSSEKRAKRRAARAARRAARRARREAV